jgi:hypothetical protein
MESGPEGLGAAVFGLLFFFVAIYGFFFFLAKGGLKIFADLIAISIFSFLVVFTWISFIFDKEPESLTQTKEYIQSSIFLVSFFTVVFGGLLAVILLSPTGRRRWKTYVSIAIAAPIAGILFITAMAHLQG